MRSHDPDRFTRRVLDRLPRRVRPRLAAALGAAAGLGVTFAVIPVDALLGSSALVVAVSGAIVAAAAARL